MKIQPLAIAVLLSVPTPLGGLKGLSKEEVSNDIQGV